MLAYLWAAPLTLFGLPLLLLAFGRQGNIQARDGILEAHSPVLAGLLTRWVPVRGGYAAMTVGHIVVGRNQACLEATREHEREHVRQSEWLGPFFPVAYLLASLWAAARGGCAYADNWFERQARRAGCEAPQTAVRP